MMKKLPALLAVIAASLLAVGASAATNTLSNGGSISASTVSNLTTLLVAFEASDFGNTTVSGILTNVIEEVGEGTKLHKPFSNYGAIIAESYPLVHITYKAIDEHICFVHSDTVQKPVTDEIGVGFNTAKRTTPSKANVTIGTVSPVAHHGLFVNVLVNTVRAFNGRFGSTETTIQGGGYVTY